MKIICAIFIWSMALIAHAQTVRVANLEVIPGDTVDIGISLSGGKGQTYTAFSFNMQLPSTFFKVTDNYVIANEWQDALAVIGDVDEFGHVVVALASANKIEEPEVNNLIKIGLKVDESTPIGFYNASLTNILLEYGFSERDNVEDAYFVLNVVDNPVTKMDNCLWESTTNRTYYDLMGRKIISKDWRNLKDGIYVINGKLQIK